MDKSACTYLGKTRSRRLGSSPPWAISPGNPWRQGEKKRSGAVCLAHSKIRAGGPLTALPHFCPVCLKPSMIQDNDGIFVCSSCGVKRRVNPLIRYTKEANPDEASFALASVWNNNLGSDANSTLSPAVSKAIRACACNYAWGELDPGAGSEIWCKSRTGFS